VHEITPDPLSPPKAAVPVEGAARMEQLLLDLLYQLEAVGDRDESLYDTVVRQKMRNAVFFGFIKPRPGFVLPDDYGTPEAENRAIRVALEAYIDGARALATTMGLDTFHKRLAAFQISAIQTAEQKNDYEEFVGWSDPALFDEAGNVTRLQ